MNLPPDLTRKEANKLIERTCKHDAYQAVYLWISTQKSRPAPTYGDAEWYAKVKMEGHAEWLAEQKYEYEFSTSTFVERKREEVLCKPATET